MNEYCKHTIKRFHDLYISRQFDQDDLALLFVVTRDYFNQGDIVRELGDFIAHPKEKTKGIVLNNLKNKVLPKFDKFLDKHKRGSVDITKLPTFDVLCSDNALIKEMEKIFELADITPVKILSESNNFREFVFCLIFLLGNYRLVLNGEILEMSVLYSHGLTLSISVESSKKSHNFAQIPVLKIPNVWVKCPTIPVQTSHKLEQYIARRFDDGGLGFMAAISFENDQGRKIYNTKNFERGQFWPLPFRAKYS